jgi:hypothetical protein
MKILTQKSQKNDQKTTREKKKRKEKNTKKIRSEFIKLGEKVPKECASEKEIVVTIKIHSEQHKGKTGRKSYFK